MAFFFQRRRRSYIAIDFGSHSIKVAIFEKPITGIVPVNINKIVMRLIHGLRDSQAFASLNELLNSMLKEKQRTPEKIVIGIGPNMAETSFQEWKIGSLHLRELLTPTHIQQYFQQLFNEHRDEDHAFLGYPISIEINGYPADISSLASYDGPAIKEITFHAVMLKFSDEAGSAFGDLKKVFSGIPIEFIPLQAIAGEVLGASCAIHDGILVDIGGSVTTVMFIKQGSLIHLNSFPIGTHRFSHRIIKARGGKFVEAQDLTRQYSQGLISKEDQMKLSHVFSEEMTEWKNAFIHSLEIFYPVAPLPRDVYIYGGGSYIPEVRSAFWAPEVLKNFSSYDSLNVHIIQAPQIFNNDPLQGLIKGPEDVGLASLMYYSLYHLPLF